MVVEIGKMDRRNGETENQGSPLPPSPIPKFKRIKRRRKMKRNRLFAVIGVLLVMNILSYGCSKKVVKEETSLAIPQKEEVTPKPTEEIGPGRPVETLLSGEVKPPIPLKEEPIAGVETKKEAPIVEAKVEKGKEGPTRVERDELAILVEKEGRLMPIYFDFDRFTIREDARPILERNASWLKKNLAIKVQVQGHADERGSDEYNLALGERRAQSARGYLVNLGIDPSRLSTISYGEERPADPLHNEEAWAKNRRAEFVIVK